MPDQTTPTPLEISFDLALKDCLFGAWAGYLQRRRRMRLTAGAPRARAFQGGVVRTIAMFVMGLILGYFQFTAAGIVLIAAANTLGYLPQIAPDAHRFLATATVVIGFLWLWLLVGPSIEKSRYEAACKKLWRCDFPEILQGTVPVSAKFWTGFLAFKMLGSDHTLVVRPSVKLIETDAYCLLQLGSTQLPIAKSKLSAQTLNEIRNWSMAANIFFTPIPPRPTRLPPKLSAWLGVALCLSCLWVGTHIREWPKSVAYPTSVRLALRDATTIVAGQVVNLEHLTYSASANQGVLYDQLSGTISRPEIAGTFFTDRNGTPFLARTAQAEFDDERTWHLTIGQIPADATMEPLPESGVFIAWDQPPTADYPGHCAALRANSGTTPLSQGRVLWRNRLFIQACSASMAKADVRDWMLQAIQPLNRELALRTQTK